MVVGEFTQETHLLVIGAGPGGYTAAFRAAELGVQTTIIDPRDAFGGECLHAGCISSKTLLHMAAVIRQAREADALGLAFAEPAVNLDRVRSWIDGVIDRLARGLESQAKKLSVERLGGAAHFEDGKHVAVRGGSIPRVKFRRAIIATGSRLAAHPVVEPDGERVWDPARALSLPFVPAHLLILGGDYTAIELVEIFLALGSTVSIAHPEARLLPEGDADLLRPLERRLGASGVTLRPGADVTDLAEEGGRLRVRLSAGDQHETVDVDAVVLTTPRAGNTASLDLAKTKADLDDDGFVRVNERLGTSDPRILAVGDVTGPPHFADRALVQGRIAGEIISGRPSIYDPQAVPFVMFSEPQVAWCGLTETAAGAEGITVKTVRIPWGMSGRAVGMGRAEGLTKLIYDADSQLVLGVGLCGTNAAELIGEAALAVEMGCELTDLAETMHPHPTMAELLADAARKAITDEDH